MNDKSRNVDDLSTIVSFVLKRQVESQKMQEEKSKILANITEMLKTSNINRERLVNYADSLQILSEWESSEKKMMESLESKFIAILIYHLINDKEHLTKLINRFNILLKETLQEVLAWKQYDRAYLLEIFNLLRDAILMGPDKVEIVKVEYISKVHPYIRDVQEIILAYLSSEKSIADLKNAFNRYETFSEENGLADIWGKVKRLVSLTRDYLRMRGAVAEP